MKTKQQIKEKIKLVKKEISSDGASAMATAGYLTALEWVLEDEFEVGDIVSIRRLSYGYTRYKVIKIDNDPAVENGKRYQVQYIEQPVEWCSKGELDLFEKKKEYEDACIKKSMQEQSDRLNKLLAGRKPIKDNPDADLIPEPAIDDYQVTVDGEDGIKYTFPNPEKMKVTWLPESAFTKEEESTDDEWVKNAKVSCETTIKGAEEAVEYMKEHKQFPYTDRIHPGMKDSKEPVGYMSKSEQEKYTKILDELCDTVQTVKWHDASKELPEDKKDVLVYCPDSYEDFYCIAHRFDNEWCCDDYIVKPIAWMELPNKPKFEEK